MSGGPKATDETQVSAGAGARTDANAGAASVEVGQDAGNATTQMASTQMDNAPIVQTGDTGAAIAALAAAAAATAAQHCAPQKDAAQDSTSQIDAAQATTAQADFSSPIAVAGAAAAAASSAPASASTASPATAATPSMTTAAPSATAAAPTTAATPAAQTRSTKRLSSPINELAAHYDALVIGSGYGGGVSASRLARMGMKVALFERGREIQVGDFPDTLMEAQQEFQVSGPGAHVGSKTALYDMHIGADIHVLVGCGLGGTSLINANVSLPPDPRVWEDRHWPRELIADEALEEGFRRGVAMLRPQPYPNKVRLDKMQRFKESADALGVKLTTPPINVNFKDGVNAANVYQPACTLCGDCCSGCNVGAKNTTQMTYLPDAVNHGAQIFCETVVSHVEKDGAGWRVYYSSQLHGRDAFHAPERSVTADIVVLGAGALGSAEILLRSREAGLSLSDKLGHSFTGNGDVLAFGYNNDRPVNAIGVGHPPRADVSPPGPCITGAIDLRGTNRLEDGMIIEEGVVPSGLSQMLPAMFAANAVLFGKDTDHGVVDEIAEKARELKSQLLGAYRGAIHHTQTMLVMAHDSGHGVIELGRQSIEVKWPQAARQDVFKHVEEKLFEVTKAQGGTYVRNPVQFKILGENLVTVHPLGGCPMGQSRDFGVVNHKCQVFDGDPFSAVDAVHDGLYVCDGSVVPRPLGVNPLLTITALSERAMIHLAQDRSRQFTAAPLKTAPIRIAGGAGDEVAAPLGVEFTERMAGFIAPSSSEDFAEAAARGEAAGNAFSFTLTVQVADIDVFVADRNHSGRIVGTVDCPALSPEPMDVVAGNFNLMRPDPDRVETRRFDYNMEIHDRDGQVYDFKGYKIVRGDKMGADLWNDTTTLYVEVAPRGVAAQSEIARGILTIAPLDFARQLTTMRAIGGEGPLDKAKAVAQFGLVFAGALFGVYGAMVAPIKRFDPDHVRKKRPLRVSPPEVYVYDTSDDKRLQLKRYNGGDKGPILFTHGLGVSSQIFSIDTIDTNLLEYFFAQGYDCWLLDFRASIDLPYAAERWSADDCAKFDYQPAINLMRDVTKRSTVQVIAHCFGATTFVMSMLSGLEGVRSAVISQIAADVIVPFFPQRMLAFLRTPSILDMAGFDVVNARATTKEGFFARRLDGLVRWIIPFQREERTRSATSNRITALYGQLYETAQLNRLTFEFGLPEMFAEANIDAFKQLALITRKKIIVDANGLDVYRPHVKRLAIPICFIHGEKNACFRPISTKLTQDWLSNANGAGLYQRHVIPGYGHIDCIFGKNAAVDVYPHMLRHLERTALI